MAECGCEEQKSGDAIKRALPLQGVVILDFTHVIAGPFATQILADLGATVIKIEGVAQNDSAREIGPFLNGQSHYYLTFNRNKKSIAIDLQSPKGQTIIWLLARKADVVVENFSPGVMDRLGFGRDEVISKFPNIIYCSISGFGQDGPLAQKRSYDLIGQAYSGVMTVNGEDGSAPLKVGIPIGDTASGLFSVIGILASLLRRKNDNRGELIDISMHDCLTTMLGNHAGYYLATGRQAPRTGSHHYVSYPNGAYRVSDGHIVLAVASDDMWLRFCKSFGLDDLANRPENVTIAQRSERRGHLDRIIAERLSQVSREKALELLDKAGIPCGPINNISEALSHPQTSFRKMVRQINHAVYGTFSTVCLPLGEDLFQQQPAAPPLKGEHTVALLREIGFSEAEVFQLEKEMIVMGSQQ